MDSQAWFPTFGGAVTWRRGRGYQGPREGAGVLPRARTRPDEDADLVARTLGGDTEAFAPIVERYHRQMLATALQMLGDPEAAHDCTQEAFIEAYRSLGNLRDRSSFRPWLFGILRNRCRKQLSRRRMAWLPLEEELDIPAGQHAEQGDDLDLDEIRSVLGELSPSYREVLAARYLADMDYEEIAVSLHTSVNNVRVRCCRARERLRELLVQRGVRREGTSGDPESMP